MFQTTGEILLPCFLETNLHILNFHYPPFIHSITTLFYYCQNQLSKIHLSSFKFWVYLFKIKVEHVLQLFRFIQDNLQKLEGPPLCSYLLKSRTMLSGLLSAALCSHCFKQPEAVRLLVKYPHVAIFWTKVFHS